MYCYPVMKKSIIIACISILSVSSYGQLQADLNSLNRTKNKITRTGMVVLGSWAAANLVYSGIATGQTSGTTKYFHQMNVMWGGINLGLAALGYMGTKNKDGLTLSQTLKKMAGVEKTYLFNFGLDAAYVASGFYLKERSKNTVKNAQKFKGYGESIIVQGAALFVLDGVMFALHNNNSKKLHKLMDKTQVGITGNGIGVIVKL